MLTEKIRNQLPYKPCGHVCVFLSVILFSPLAAADDFVCHWAHGPIVIDGSDDDLAWSHATTIDRFLIPASANPIPKAATRARLLWDRQYLYFFAEMDDHDLFADVVEHDGKTWDNDVFEIFLITIIAV